MMAKKKFPAPPAPTVAKYFPASSGDPIALADWLELMALTAPDGDASAGDLERPLRRLGNSAPEGLIGQVFTEIDRRAIASGDGYPFVRDESFISRRGTATDYLPYVFCLLLSFFKWKAKANVAHNPWLLFEELAHVAAGQYLDAAGTSMIFGTSARKKKQNFRESISNLCERIQEGNGFREQKTNAKDDKLDVVVWKEFPDRGAAKVIMFGQCAAGADWSKKVSELQPDAFSTQWFNVTLISPIIRSFYVPHRINSDQWEYIARRAGVLFDRCRIAHFAHKQNTHFLKDKRYLACCNLVSPVPLN
jgi:hypothetical protein